MIKIKTRFVKLPKKYEKNNHMSIFFMNIYTNFTCDISKNAVAVIGAYF